MQKILIPSFLLFLASCTSQHPLSSEHAVLLPLAEASHVLQQCSRSSPQPFNGAWTVSPALVVQVERDLPKISALTSQDCCSKGMSVADPRSYYRQYAGVIIGGVNYIYVNAFRNHFNNRDKLNWRSKAMLACDGGTSFWGVLYNPATRQFSQLSFNGPA